MTTKYILIASANLFLMLMSSIPATAETKDIIICAHPQGSNTSYRSAIIKVKKNGFPMTSVERPIQRDDNCYLLRVPECSKNIEIQASSSEYYSGSATCRGTPQPIKIAMSGKLWEITTAAFNLDGFDSENGSQKEISGFRQDQFIAEIARSDEIIKTLSLDAISAKDNLTVALAERDFASAQLYANELSEHLRNADEESLALTYSSITYLAGFDAIGFDAISSDSPLVTAAEPTGSSFVIMSTDGRDVLKTYQSLKGIDSQEGVWDYPTTKSVSDINIDMGDFDTDTPNKPVRLPKDWSPQIMSIDSSGRMQMR